MSSERKPAFDSFLVRSLVTLVIPQGYTLSIAGSFALAVRRYGFPFDLNAWGFVAGAVAAFVALAVIARGSLGGSLAMMPMGLRALINVVPLIVVLGVAGVVALVPFPELGLPTGRICRRRRLRAPPFGLPLAGRVSGRAPRPNLSPEAELLNQRHDRLVRILLNEVPGRG